VSIGMAEGTPLHVGLRYLADLDFREIATRPDVTPNAA
jgi:hypothetical protein